MSFNRETYIAELRPTILDALSESIKKLLCDDIVITSDTQLHWGFDSLDRVEIIMYLEDELDVLIDDSWTEKLWPLGIPYTATPAQLVDQAIEALTDTQLEAVIENLRFPGRRHEPLMIDLVS